MIRTSWLPVPHPHFVILIEAKNLSSIERARGVLRFAQNDKNSARLGAESRTTDDLNQTD
jgi:hypothetical protein